MVVLFSTKRSSRKKTKKKNSKGLKKDKAKSSRRATTGTTTGTTTTTKPPQPKSNRTGAPRGKDSKRIQVTPGKGSVGKKTNKDTRASDWKERKEQDSEKDDEMVSRSKNSQVIGNSSQFPKSRKVEITNRDVDESTMERVFEKFTKEKKMAQPLSQQIDEKSRILMDRVTKKPYSMKKCKSEKSELLIDEPSTFFNPKKEKKKMEESVFLEQDTYDQVPKLINVRKMPPENIYTERGVPFWAEVMEPTEEELKDIEPPISVGSDHLEMYHDKKFTLRTVKSVKIVLNELLPLADLIKRDEIHFNNQLVFSNTIRSLIHAQAASKRKEVNDEKKVEEEQKEKKTRFVVGEPPVIFYSRNNPIQSIREILSAKAAMSTTTTTTTTTTSCDGH